MFKPVLSDECCSVDTFNFELFFISYKIYLCFIEVSVVQWLSRPPNTRKVASSSLAGNIYLFIFRLGATKPKKYIYQKYIHLLFFRLGATKPKKYIYQFPSFKLLFMRKFQLRVDLCNASVMNWWQSKAILMNKNFMFESFNFFGKNQLIKWKAWVNKTNKQDKKMT